MSHVSDLRRLLIRNPQDAFDVTLSRNDRLPFFWMGPAIANDCGQIREDGRGVWRSEFVGVQTPRYHLRGQNESLVLSAIARTFTGFCGPHARDDREFSMQLTYVAAMRGHRLELTEADDNRSLDGQISERDSLAIDGVRYQVSSTLSAGAEVVTLAPILARLSNAAGHPLTFIRAGGLLTFSSGGNAASSQGRALASLLNAFEAGYRAALDRAVGHGRP